MKRFSTKFTRPKFYSSVNFAMFCQRIFVRKSFSTQPTWKGLFSGMSSFMFSKATTKWKASLTDVTRERFLSSVNSLMTFQWFFSTKTFHTDLTLKTVFFVFFFVSDFYHLIDWSTHDFALNQTLVSVQFSIHTWNSVLS